MPERLYDDKELLDELNEKVEELGGKLIVIDLRNKVFRLDVDDVARDYATVMIYDIVKKYRINRAKLLTENPFIGTQAMVDELKNSEG